MSIGHQDTTDASWVAQREAIAAMEPSSRLQVAIDLSESVREIQIAGLLARHPLWSRGEAVRWLIQRFKS